MNIYKHTLRLLLIASFLIIAACSSSDNDGNAGGNMNVTPAAPTTLNGVLSGDQEVPPAVTNGSGTSTVTVTADESTIDYIIDINGPLSSDITQAHFHTGAIGNNGPITFWLCTNLGNAPAGITAPPACTQPPVTFSGSFTSADFDAGSGLASFADAVDGIINLDAYINVHTVNIASGELRGQIGTTP